MNGSRHRFGPRSLRTSPACAGSGAAAFSALLLLAACGSRRSDEAPGPRGLRPSPTSSATPSSPATAGPLPIDPRDQYALANAMIEGQQVDPDEQPASFARVHGSWAGKRYRWSMMRIEPLCRSADDCLVAPFDLGRFAFPLDFSFLPRVAFSSEQHAAHMRDACAPHGLECVVTFEATLSDFQFELGIPPGLTLTDAHFVSARRRNADEYFLSRPRRPLASGPFTRHSLGAPPEARP